MESDSPYQREPDDAFEQMPEDLEAAHRYLERLKLKYRMVERRLTEHLERAQHLSNALASERAARLAMQARVAELERHVQQLLAERAVNQSTAKRTDTD